MNDTEQSNRDGAVDLNALIAAEVHDLKNRLGQLTLSLDELSITYEGMADALREPRNNCHLIGESLVQILTLYRTGQTRIALNLEAHSPLEFIDELKADAESLAGPAMRIERKADSTPPFWFFDRYLVDLAMANAIHNAIKFAHEKITLGATPRDGGLEFFIHDDSAGFPEDVLMNQGRAPSNSRTGTGLGLYFARAIATAHVNNGRTGKVRLENRDGAYFSLWLP